MTAHTFFFVQLAELVGCIIGLSAMAGWLGYILGQRSAYRRFEAEVREMHRTVEMFCGFQPNQQKPFPIEETALGEKFKLHKEEEERKKTECSS